jgi:hypothetical protein
MRLDMASSGGPCSRDHLERAVMALDGLREERNLMFELFQPLVDLVGG